MIADHTVDVPGGGQLRLQNAEEVEFWNKTARGFIEDYGLTKINDLALLSSLLSQHLIKFRAVKWLEDPNKSKGAGTVITEATKEIRELEKALGIDKKSREAGGQHTVADYITRLKLAAHAKGVRIADRVKAYEALCNEMSWKIRLLHNGDDEDRQYHGISERAIIDWAEAELRKIEESEQEWSKTTGKAFIGRL